MTCARINQLAIGDWEYDNGLWTAYPAVYEEKETDLGLTADGLDVSVLHDGRWVALGLSLTTGATDG